MTDKTHVLVTGGAGYIGSLMCPTLLADGYKVTALDTCYFGKDFLPHDNPEFRLIEGDIRGVGDSGRRPSRLQ